MKITVAPHCGFCAGVKQAVKKAEENLTRYPAIYMLGDIVHNRHVVADLEEKGLKKVPSLDKIPAEAPLLLRAHGTEKNIIEAARQMAIPMIDATCPLVLDIHKHSLDLEAEGRQVIVVGDPQHDEVKGICSNLKDPLVVSCAKDLENANISHRCGVVVQSTQFENNLQDIVSLLLTKSADCRIINTICLPTRRNREELKDLAQTHDMLIIIGDPASANSNRLFAMAASLNPRSRMISAKEDLQKEWFEDVDSVGITAGASTPDHLIEDVKKHIIKLSHGE